MRLWRFKIWYFNFCSTRLWLRPKRHSEVLQNFYFKSWLKKYWTPFQNLECLNDTNPFLNPKNYLPITYSYWIQRKPLLNPPDPSNCRQNSLSIWDQKLLPGSDLKCITTFWRSESHRFALEIKKFLPALHLLLTKPYIETRTPIPRQSKIFPLVAIPNQSKST